MALFFEIKMKANGMDGADDGQTAWGSTLLCFSCQTARFLADVQQDLYSGQYRAFIKEDEFRLPPRLAGPLAIALLKQCGSAMEMFDADFGEAFCDVEELSRQIFYRTDAEMVLRKMRTTIAASRLITQPTLPK